MSALTQTRDHCRLMANHHGTPSKDRRIWVQIADEIDRYLVSELEARPMDIDQPMFDDGAA